MCLQGTGSVPARVTASHLSSVAIVTVVIVTRQGWDWAGPGEVPREQNVKGLPPEGAGAGGHLGSKPPYVFRPYTSPFPCPGPTT